MSDPDADPKARLAREQTAALKAGEKTRLGALRLLSAAVKNREVELRHPLNEEEFVEVAGREAKRRREAIEAYEGAGREDRAALEREELEVLSTYLPAALGDDEVAALVEEAISATGASGSGDMGKVMGHVMARAKGRADGKAVQALVRSRLAG
ncbi:MAG: GatB/YqeY domain-containing protein [Actinobacteria bacterium]|nr:GatB/YqeY domain-containing protein [Actinomycetota bacterium]